MKSILLPYLKINWRLLLGVYVALGAFLASVAGLKFLSGLPLSELTRDPISVAGLLPFVGIVSNMGALLWTAGASICLFAAILLWQWQAPRSARFLFYSGLITLLLLMDDFFIVHESMRDYFGIPELVTYGIYLTLLAVYLFTYRTELLNQHVLLFVLAGGFMGLSVGMDVVQKSLMPILPGYFLFEDGFKLFSITTWMLFFAYTAITHLSLARDQYETS